MLKNTSSLHLVFQIISHLDADAVLGNAEHGGELLLEAKGPCLPKWTVISCFSWTGTASAMCGSQKKGSWPPSLKVPITLPSLVTLSALFSTVGSQRVE